MRLRLIILKKGPNTDRWNEFSMPGKLELGNSGIQDDAR